MQTYTCRRSSHALKFSSLSSFWWNEPTWQAKTIISCFHWLQLNIARANQSAPQECQFATPTKNKQTKTNRAGFKSRPLAFGLGQVIRLEKAINTHARTTSTQPLTNCDIKQGIQWSKARINFILRYLFVIWQPNEVWGFDEWIWIYSWY